MNTEIDTLKKLDIDTTREVDYVITDEALNEPFIVYKSQSAWWSSEKQGKVKIEALMESFKKCLKVNQAIVLAKITTEQWRYFNEQYPTFSLVKARCEEITNMHAKQTISTAVKEDWHAASWFLERREPETYGRRENTPLQLQNGESVVTMIQEAFVDKDGNLIRKRKSITIDHA